MTSTTLPGTNPTEHGTATATPDFGDTRAEFQALLSGCGLYDLSGRAKIAVTGGDRVRWLNGMVSNNVRDLAAGHGVYAFHAECAGPYSGRPLRLSARRIAAGGYGTQRSATKYCSYSIATSLPTMSRSPTSATSLPRLA
jgi:hypothetical protein